MEPIRKRVYCNDGFNVSIQANMGAYCYPREDGCPWYSEVELGFPSDVPTPEIMEHCESPDKPTETVYGYVPVAKVKALIELHGGMKSGEIPPGILDVSHA